MPLGDSQVSDLKSASLFKQSDFLILGALLVAMGVLAAARSTHYLFFHTMAELFAIVISFSIFVLTWVSSRYLNNGYLIVLGGSYAAVGLVDIFHTLTFQGMNLFPGVSTNYPTQFWLTARFLEALALLCAPFVIDRKPSFTWVSTGFATLAIAACVAVMNQWFPATFVEGGGLTAFKVYAEYVIIAMLVLGFVMLYHFKTRFEPRIFLLLLVSLVLAVVTEFCFTRYVSFYDFTNEIGHYSRFLSSTFAFMAIVLSGVRQPFDLIFREIKEQQRGVDALNAKLRQSEERYRRQFLDNKAVMLLLDPADGQIIDANPAASAFYGYAHEQLLAMRITDINPMPAAEVRAAMQSVMPDGAKHFEFQHRLANGSLRDVETFASQILLEERKTLHVIVHDITERKRLETALRESEGRLSAVFESSPVGIVVTRVVDGKILDINDACLRLYQYTREDAIGRTVAELGAYAKPEQRAELLKLLGNRGFVDGFLIDFLTHDGTPGVLETSGRIIEIAGEPCLLAMVTDVTERQRAHAAIHEQAFHDGLTQLPNRLLLSNRLQQAMIAAKRTGCYGALMYLDLDNFKPLNDVQGHDVGDLLLIEVAARLRTCVREMDTVARVGGDEFVVMLSELTPDQAESMTQATTVAEKVCSALANPYLLVVRRDGQVDRTVEHRCTASIGVVLFVNDEVSQDEILNRADVAMYEAKREGRNLIRFYESGRS